MDVSENSGTPKSSISIGFSIINHPFWGTPILGNTHISHYKSFLAAFVGILVWLRLPFCIAWQLNLTPFPETSEERGLFGQRPKV